MTKITLLETYLQDPIILENNILSADEVENIEWNFNRSIPLIDILKIVIEEIEQDNTPRTILRKVNSHLSNNL